METPFLWLERGNYGRLAVARIAPSHKRRPDQAGYLYLLTAYTPEEIESALNELGYGEQGKTDSSIQEG